MKKTQEIINSLRGKGERQIKPKFIIDNEKIINRRVIANEFQKGKSSDIPIHVVKKSSLTIYPFSTSFNAI